MDNMREELSEIVCGALQCDDCVAHCNHGCCNMVESVVDALIARGVVLPNS